MDSDVLVAGETLIDFLPERPGPLSDVEGFDRRPGGAPANVAVALARLERTPLFWTRVGDDPFGRYLESVLAEQGLPDRFVERDPGAKTTLAFVTHDERGDRSFSFYRDGTADTRLEAGTVPDETLADLEWVHVGGVTLASGPAREATLDLLARAADAGCTVSFDPNMRPELWSDEGTFAGVAREALAHVDVLKATAEELRALGFGGDGSDAPAADGDGSDAPAADGNGPDALASAALADGPHTVFVTRGSEGALAVAAEAAPWSGRADHPGFDADVVDTTGAGDAFVAGAIAALSDGEDLSTALEFASAVAASATTAPGAMSALPDRESVTSFLADRGR